MSRFPRHSPWIFALLTILSACSLFPSRPPAPALHDFGLQGGVSGFQSGNSEPAAWSSVTVQAPEWLQTENIRYRLLHSDPTRVRFYSEHRWLAPPPALLAQRLDLNSGVDGYALKIKLLEFEQVFEGPQNASLMLSFRAICQRPGKEGVAAEKLFRFSRPTPSADAQGAVATAYGLIDQAAKSLQTWLVELPPH